MQATIELQFESAAKANIVLNAIDPDNSPVPPGLEIHTTAEGNVLRICVNCERDIDSFRATIEDIMSAIDLAMRAQESVT